jgi:hypothetical protein
LHYISLGTFDLKLLEFLYYLHLCTFGVYFSLKL